MDILRIAALGTAGVLLGITVKGAKPEFALLVTVGAGLCILAGTVGKMQYLLGMLAQMKSYLPVDSSYLSSRFLTAICLASVMPKEPISVFRFQRS